MAPTFSIESKNTMLIENESHEQIVAMERDWSELPYDVMTMILPRVGVIDILENAQKVCKDWYHVCNDPSMWKSIYMEGFCSRNGNQRLREMSKRVIEKSGGQLVEITLRGFIHSSHLIYVAERSNKLTRLKLSSCTFGYSSAYLCWSDAFEKIPLLEELDVESTTIVVKDIANIGYYCPMLKTLKLNRQGLWNDNEVDVFNCDVLAKAIANKLGGLRHLELIGYGISNKGLESIVDGCRHLESLNLSGCLYLDIKGNLGNKCLKQIKHLIMPNGSVKSY